MKMSSMLTQYVLCIINTYHKPSSSHYPLFLGIYGFENELTFSVNAFVISARFETKYLVGTTSYCIGALDCHTRTEYTLSCMNMQSEMWYQLRNAPSLTELTQYQSILRMFMDDRFPCSDFGPGANTSKNI